MLNLQFHNPVFIEGEPNITVRRGAKWADQLIEAAPVDGVYQARGAFSRAEFNGSVVVNLFDNRSQSVIGVGAIESTTVLRFAELTDAMLRNHPREECQTVEGLFTVLAETYPGFEASELITIVTFWPTLSGTREADTLITDANGGVNVLEQGARTAQYTDQTDSRVLEAADEIAAADKEFQAQSMSSGFDQKAFEQVLQRLLGEQRRPAPTSADLVDLLANVTRTGHRQMAIANEKFEGKPIGDPETAEVLMAEMRITAAVTVATQIGAGIVGALENINNTLKGNDAARRILASYSNALDVMQLPADAKAEEFFSKGKEMGLF